MGRRMNHQERLQSSKIIALKLISSHAKPLGMFLFLQDPCKVHTSSTSAFEFQLSNSTPTRG